MYERSEPDIFHLASAQFALSFRQDVDIEGGWKVGEP